MSDLIDDKLKENCKLLLEKRFTIVSDVSDDLICGICKDILVNASQTICGCLFCEKCIDKYVEYNTVGCPGNTEDCKLTNLSNIMIDHRRNLMISRLIVRCNKEDCRFECKLMEMKNHLEDCSTETIECPFMIVGCAKERLSNDRMNEHLQRDSLNHNKLLLDMVNDLRNEIRELRENDEKRKYEIENLKEKMLTNEKELQILKDKNERKRTVIERCKSAIGSPQENTEKRIELDYPVALKILKTKESNNDKLKMDFENFQIKLTNFIEEMRKIKVSEFENERNIEQVKGNVERYVKETQQLKQRLPEIIAKSHSSTSAVGKDEFNNLCTRVAELEDYLDVEDGVFLWHTGVIDGLGSLCNKNYFYDRDNLYKLGLKLENSQSSVNIWLLVYNKKDNRRSDWPFRANVNVRIAHKFCRSICLSLSNICCINQPRNKRYHQSRPFIFSKSDLRNIGIPTNQSVCVVECDVDLL